MTVTELYKRLDARIPSALSCDWDNDGLMVCPDGNAAIGRVLVTLDVTERAVETAVAGGYDLILSHHPLIFRPLKRLTDPRLTELIRAGIAVMSFHTRLDALEGGVNDVLASLFSLEETQRFHKEGIGVIGTLPAPMPAPAFAALVKERLGSPFLETVLRERPCRRIAVVGGDGKDFWPAAAAAGADTYLTGSMSYNGMIDASASGMSLIAAGHFETENPVLSFLAALTDAAVGRPVCDLFDCRVAAVF
jgi:dinuclear metal center YbgI/SA1388 family protein